MEDREWQQLVQTTTRINQQIKNIKARLQSALTQLIINADEVKEHEPPTDTSRIKMIQSSALRDQKAIRQCASKSPLRSPDLSQSTELSSSGIFNSIKQNLPKQAELLSPKYQNISDRFQIGKFLGKGKFSDVFQAQ